MSSIRIVDRPSLRFASTKEASMDDLEIQRQLGDRELAIFNAELDRERKSSGTAYLLWFFLGGIGGHNFYLGKPIWGLLYAGLSILGFSMFFAGALVAGTSEDSAAGQRGAGTAIAGGAALVVLGVLVLWDLVTIPRQIRRHEARIRAQLLARLGTGE